MVDCRVFKRMTFIAAVTNATEGFIV